MRNMNTKPTEDVLEVAKEAADKLDYLWANDVLPDRDLVDRLRHAVRAETHLTAQLEMTLESVTPEALRRVQHALQAEGQDLVRDGDPEAAQVAGDLAEYLGEVADAKLWK